MIDKKMLGLNQNRQLPNNPTQGAARINQLMNRPNIPVGRQSQQQADAARRASRGMFNNLSNALNKEISPPTGKEVGAMAQPTTPVAPMSTQVPPAQQIQQPPQLQQAMETQPTQQEQAPAAGGQDNAAIDQQIAALQAQIQQLQSQKK